MYNIDDALGSKGNPVLGCQVIPVGYKVNPVRCKVNP